MKFDKHVKRTFGLALSVVIIETILAIGVFGLLTYAVISTLKYFGIVG